LAKRIAAIESTIDRYLKELDRADREQDVTGVPVPAAKVARLAQGIETLKAKLGRMSAIETQMLAAGEKQISLSDPDARAMTSQSHSAYTVGYNVQSAVRYRASSHRRARGDQRRHRQGPSGLAEKAREALGAETIEALADRGCFKSEDIAACEEVGIVPRPLTSNARAEGRYDRRDFVYDAKSDTYVCPAGERLTYRMTTEDAGKVLRRYWTDTCGTCALKAHCTPSKQRRVARWENEAVLDLVQARLDQRPDAMIVRRSTVEHPFGTIKAARRPP
jgi:hypothetical protein